MVEAGDNISDNWLVACDFDKTCALTDEPAPNGMTLELAYRQAVRVVFGDDGLRKYRDEGGLGNRTPDEIAYSLLNSGINPKLVKDYTYGLISTKLDLLLPQVGKRLEDGSRWPRPTNGFPQFWQAASEQPQVDTGVISSGHDKFIARFFEVQNLEPPNIAVTSDFFRYFTEFLPVELCVKPGRLLIDVVHQRWLARHQAPSDFDTVLSSRSRILYVGDDPMKDGQLAANAGVEFVQMVADQSEPTWSYITSRIIPQCIEVGDEQN